jgi:hypothetical protein
MMFGYRILRLFANIVIEAPWLAYSAIWDGRARRRLDATTLAANSSDQDNYRALERTAWSLVVNIKLGAYYARICPQFYDVRLQDSEVVRQHCDRGTVAGFGHSTPPVIELRADMEAHISDHQSQALDVLFIRESPITIYRAHETGLWNRTESLSTVGRYSRHALWFTCAR